jgi:hypothetical protein
MQEESRLDNIVVLGNWPEKGGIRALGIDEAKLLDSRLSLDLPRGKWIEDAPEGGSRTEYHIGQTRQDIPLGYRGVIGVFNMTLFSHVDSLARTADQYGELRGATTTTMNIDDS